MQQNSDIERSALLSQDSGSKIDISAIFPAAPPAPNFWTAFGLGRTHDGRWTLPNGVIGLEARSTEFHGALTDVTKAMGEPIRFALWTGDRRLVLYKLDAALGPVLASRLPAAVSFIGQGQPVDLPDPTTIDTGRFPARSVGDLSELAADHIGNLAVPGAEPAIINNPLLPYSLRGQSEKFKRMAVEARPLLGNVCLSGQVTLWYAAPNVGKTLVALSLIHDAVREQRIPAGNVFYVNADDNGKGLATKLQIMDDLGGNTLVPDFKGLRASELIPLLHKMADGDEARGVLVVIDTIKKFVDTMHKREASEFAQALRRVAMMGGTVLGLAHTTKNPNANGTPRYAGTSDLVDDCDAAYTLSLIDGGGDVTQKVVEFRCFKSRGDCADIAAYAFTADKSASYEDKLASVRPIDQTQLDEFQRVEAQRTDAEVIDAVTACIGQGINTKMLLTKEVASRTGISGRAAGRLIERYTGDDPAQHRWRFVRGERGAQLFEMLPALPPSSDG